MGSVDLPLHLTDHLNIFNLKMKFLILASLFVLSVVADPEAEAQRPLDLTHKTSGFVRYTNGAITPEDTDSVKAAKIQHHTLKAALTDNKKTPVTYAVNPFHQVYQPQVYGLHHHQQFVRPSVYGVHRQHQQVLPGTGGPYLMPAARHFGKRDAEAEPEAEAEAEAQYYGSQYYGQYYGTPASTYPLARYPYASAYTTGYPSTYNTAYTTGYPSIYNTALTGYPSTYNLQRALTGYPNTYNTALTGYPSIYNTAYTGYPNTYNTAFTGYPSIYKAALYNKAVQKQ